MDLRYLKIAMQEHGPDVAMADCFQDIQAITMGRLLSAINEQNDQDKIENVTATAALEALFSDLNTQWQECYSKQGRVINKHAQDVTLEVAKENAAQRRYENEMYERNAL